MSGREVGMRGVVKPDFDDRALDREVSKLERRMDDAARIVPELNIGSRLRSQLESLVPGGKQIGRGVDRVRDKLSPASQQQTSSTQGARSTETLLVAQLDKLTDIEDMIEKLAVTDRGDGGGGGGGGAGLGFTLGRVFGGGGGGIAGLLGGTAGTVAGGIGLSALLGNPANEGTLTNRAGDAGARLLGGERFANMSGDERQAETYRRIQQATNDLSDRLSTVVSDIQSFEWPIPEIPELRVPEVPALDVPDLPRLEFETPPWLGRIEQFLSGPLFGSGQTVAERAGDQSLSFSERRLAQGDAGNRARQGKPLDVQVENEVDLNFDVSDVERAVDNAVSSVMRGRSFEQMVIDIVRRELGI